MSLQVWLPLNGDLRNQGCTGYTITAIEASPTFTTGKIGQCYQRANTSSQITNGLQIQDNLVSTFGTAASVAVWVKPLGTHTHYNGTILSSGDWNRKRWAFGVSQDNSQVDVLCGGYNNYISCPVPVNQWTHLASTFENGVCKLYKNGVYVGEKSGQAAFDSDANWTGICRETYAGGYFGFNGCINDLRIYDHCLSAAEVHEIAQGLILHYKLDSFQQGGNPNLLARYVVPGQAGPTSTANGGRTIWAGDYKIIIPASENADTYFRLFMTEQLTANTVYTISCEVSGLLTGSQYNFPLFAQGNTSMGILALNHNGLCSLTFTMTWTGTQTATTGANGETVYVNFLDDASRSLASGQGPITLSNFKLEKGTSVTAWCPSGISDNIIEDNSGYNHNGTINSSPIISSETMRYGSSIIFDGVDDCIKIPFNDIIKDKNYTVSVWTYKASIGTKNYQTILGGPSGFELEARSSSSTSPLYRIHNWGGGTTAYEFNKWNLFTFVHTDSNSKLYVNGELKITGTSANIPTGNYYIGAWNSVTGQNYEGLMSDFRIYCTALDTDAIRQLYEVGAKVDNKGNLHTFELNEQASNIIFNIEKARTNLTFTDGLSRYTQANCQVNLVEDGYHIYRPPNLTQSANGNTMWGGLQLVNQSVNTVAAYDANRDNWWHLQQNHTYIAAFHARGKSSNATTWSWTNNMGWGGGGVQPSPTTIVNEGIPADFNGEKDCFYIFKITDAISKPCTTAYSVYVAGTTYLSYRHLTFGWGYTSTGTLGTDLYLTNFRLYDITSNMAQFTKQGQANFYDIIEQMDKAQIRKNSELLSSEFIEL